MCIPWGKGGKLSRFLEDPGHTEGAAALCQCAQGRAKLSPADLRLTGLHRLPIWAGSRKQRLLDVSQGAPAAGARSSPILWKTPPPTAKPTHTPRGSRQGRHRGSDITGTGSPLYPTAPPRLYRPGQPATKERTGGGGAAATSPLPPPVQSLGQHGGDRWERAALGWAGAGPGGKSESEVGAQGGGDWPRRAGAGEEGRPPARPPRPPRMRGGDLAPRKRYMNYPKLQRKPTPAPNQIKCFRGWCLRLLQRKAACFNRYFTEALRCALHFSLYLEQRWFPLRALDLPGF